MVNRVVLIGRLTKDPEKRTTGTGKSVADFFIAVPRRFKTAEGQPDTDFFRVSAWGPNADYVHNYLTKGRLVAVEGRLQSRKYTASDGTNREVVEIVADNVQGLDRPREDGGSSGSYESPASKAALEPEPEPAPSSDEYDPFESQ